MDFKDWYNKELSNDKRSAVYIAGAKRGFEASQQRKQEEVNKLQVQIDELQKRIDDALDHTVNHGGYDDLTHVINILKGK